MKKMNNKVLLIDDDKSFLNVYSKILAKEGYDVFAAQSGAKGLEAIEQNDIKVVICDVAMPEMNGIEVLEAIKAKYSDTLVLMLTGEGSINGAVEAMEKGAYTYMIKPVEISQLTSNISRAIELQKLNSENIRLKSTIESGSNNDKVIGNSNQMKDILALVDKVAPTNANVLITGESGTGKEVIANLIHNSSSRAQGPMVKVNCSALSDNLLESELFGAIKGAYTGAVNDSVGRVEKAKGGTLFLDEIGDMSLSLQSKVLRVIQEKEFEKVGSSETIKADFRLVCATNKDLKKEIKAGNFREDLYFRINVVPIATVPLRERREDIKTIMDYYLDYYADQMKKQTPSISDEALNILCAYSWPGNVRELKNTAERLVVLCDERQVEAWMLPQEMMDYETTEYTDGFKKAKADFEKQYLKEKLEEFDWNISRTAKEIGLARKNLQAKIKQYNLGN